MPDRFDFLEIGDTRPTPPPPDATDAALAAPTWRECRLKAVELIGEQGVRGGQFNTPVAISTDRDGSLYVADYGNHRVQRITTGDAWIYGRPGSGAGQLLGPRAVAVDPTGQFFFVAEQGNSRVQCFRFNGQHQAMYSGFKSPSGLAFDAEGMLWIADTGNGRVLRLNTRTGQFIGGLDSAAGVVQPISIACDRAHNIYVTDAATNDVCRYTYFGVRAHALGEIRRLASPQQAAIDGDGRIYLAEAAANRLHVFAPNGDSLVTFDTPSTKLGPFKEPMGVALGPGGEVYVADTQNHRILRLAWE